MNGGPASIYEGGRIEADQFLACPLGSASGQQLHVGFRSDHSRMPKALLILLRVAHRWPASKATGI